MLRMLTSRINFHVDFYVKTKHGAKLISMLYFAWLLNLGGCHNIFKHRLVFLHPRASLGTNLKMSVTMSLAYVEIISKKIKISFLSKDYLEIENLGSIHPKVVRTFFNLKLRSIY